MGRPADPRVNPDQQVVLSYPSESHNSGLAESLDRIDHLGQ